MCLYLSLIVLLLLVLQLNFRTTWGDAHYFGLTGIEIVGADGVAMEIQPEQLQVSQ